MAERNRPHILVKGSVHREKYRAPRSGSTPAPPPRDRVQHAARLQAQLEAALAEAKRRQHEAPALLVPEAPAGMCIEVRGKSDEKSTLPLDRLASEGGVLLSVRSEANQQIATAYLPKRALSRLQKKLSEYSAKDTKKGRPRHEPLASPIEEIRVAELRSLWTDPPERLPPLDRPAWWEVWLTRDTEDGAEIRRFKAFADQVGLHVLINEPLKFPERVVLLTKGTGQALAAAFGSLGNLAELRLARPCPHTFLELCRQEQSALTQRILEQIQEVDDRAPAVCLLDTGVNRNHPLLQPALRPVDMHAYNPAWGAEDQDGHGTKMAGLALLGDLHPVLVHGQTSPLTHRLESVKILPHPTQGENDPTLYGHVTREAAARVEVQAPDRKRIFCMAVSTPEFRERGRPTSWSAAIDALACGMDEQDQPRRLFLISASNPPRQPTESYSEEIETSDMEDPAQAWNAITCGCYTEKDEITEPDLQGWSPLAPRGTLSPCTTGSMTWEEQWPLKPDVLLEGGNYAISPKQEVLETDSLSLISTSREINTRLWTQMSANSAATAQGSRMAAGILAQYPDLWPETIRALLVHSAEWTAPMREDLDKETSLGRRARLLRKFGFGVPNLDRARFSAADALTLIAEEAVTPVSEHGTLGQLHIHRLPWPKDVLQDLGEAQVRLRVTLSYFIEPNPAERGWKGRYQYASHGLRFDVKEPTDDEARFRKRVNKLAREDGERVGGKRDTKGWILGPQARHHGSLHADIWEGSAAELAERGMVAVYPVSGWWKYRKPYRGRRTRYSLVVSIETPGVDVDVDIYTPVLQQVQTPIVS